MDKFEVIFADGKQRIIEARTFTSAMDHAEVERSAQDHRLTFAIKASRLVQNIKQPNARPEPLREGQKGNDHV